MRWRKNDLRCYIGVDQGQPGVFLGPGDAIRIADDVVPIAGES